MRISQFVAGMSIGDAITNYVFSLHSMMQTWPGVETEIFYIDQHVPFALKSKGKPYQEYKPYSSKENIIVLHFGNGSELAPFIAGLPDRKIMIYHNITPAKYFNMVAPNRIRVQNEGLEQLKSLVQVFDLALGVSEYNRKDLAQLGFPRTGVLPLVLDETLLKISPSKKVLHENRDHLNNIVCIGRIAPNKRVEDVLRVMYYLQRTCDLSNRLFLVGSFGGMERYKMYLMNLIQELNLKRVVWCGHISQKDLVAYYKIAKVFFTMSEHEGFCMPIIEAMRFGVPVLARETSAIPETMNGEGVMFKGKPYARIAESLHILITDNALRKKVIEGQKKSIQRFSYQEIALEWKSWVDRVVQAHPIMANG